MNTIQDLYYGRVSPYEMSISTVPEYQKLKALADRNSERDMFINGFRLGMKLMMDVMKDE